MAFAIFGANLGFVLSVNFIFNKNRYMIGSNVFNPTLVPLTLALGTGSSLVLANKLAKKLKFPVLRDYYIDEILENIKTITTISTGIIGFLFLFGSYIK
jgi:hypothetical protein